MTVGRGLSVMLFSVTFLSEVLSPLVWDGCTSNYKMAEKHEI